MLAALCWALLIGGIVLLAYTYIGYPLLLAVVGRFLTSPQWKDDKGGQKPSVTLLVPVHNEADVIEQKVENVRTTEYHGEFDCLFVSDSTDGTDALLQQSMAPWMDLLTLEQRRGKSHAINRALRRIDNDVVVFSDANTMYEPGTVTTLVEPLADPKVGCVTGRLRLVDTAGETVESTYWRYELWLRALESRHGSTVGVNGGVMAVRRSDLNPLPDSALTDDHVIALQQLRAGRYIVYEPDAIATETTTGSLGAEFDRRVRIGAGNYQTLAWFPDLLNPGRGFVAIVFFSHKVLRWIAPWLLVMLLVVSTTLVVIGGGSLSVVVLSAQLACYLLAVVGLTSRTARRLVVARVAAYFLSMNVALAVGCLHFLRGPSTDIWTETPRED